ncbi:hypothetical protein Taro_020774 [Colocasia esculenta]|uniref:Uncharacterized protein n=1 Tax=Colocasia esculenta TaxID=4460 RepID=A0A843V9H1_COLES|nr:hypothetical protein [Colocasia esculenta]
MEFGEKDEECQELGRAKVLTSRHLLYFNSSRWVLWEKDLIRKHNFMWMDVEYHLQTKNLNSVFTTKTLCQKPPPALEKPSSQGSNISLQIATSEQCRYHDVRMSKATTSSSKGQQLRFQYISTDCSYLEEPQLHGKSHHRLLKSPAAKDPIYRCRLQLPREMPGIQNLIMAFTMEESDFNETNSSFNATTQSIELITSVLI